MVNHTSGNYAGAKVYYGNARRGGKVMLLTGPFLTAREAEATLDLVMPRAVKEHPELALASVGVVELNAPGDGPGPYNDMLPERIMGNLGIGVRLN